MTSGKFCPACGQDIGVWPVFSAGLPSRIRCPRCKARLRYNDTLAIYVALLLVFVGVAFLAFLITSSLTTTMIPSVLWAVIVLAAWVPVELALAWFLRNRRTLALADRRQPGAKEAP